MRQRKQIPIKELQKIIDELKAGTSINVLRSSTGYGVNILKRIIADNNIPYNVTQNHKGMVMSSFNDVFCADSKASNCRVNKYIKQFNIIEHTHCHQCGLSEWINGQLTLELDHIDGDNSNNSIDNLRYLCPNCHSQTPTYKGRGKQTGKKKVSDAILIAALKNEPNIRQALIRVGLTPKGANYERAKKLIDIL